MKLEQIATSVYGSFQRLSPIIQGIAGISITAMAYALFKCAFERQTSQETNRNALWALQKEYLYGNEEFLQKIQSIYTLDESHILNTKLEHQSLPNCLQIGFNRIAMNLGYADRLGDIRAKNVLSAIEQFINESRDEIFLNQSGYFHLTITGSLAHIERSIRTK